MGMKKNICRDLFFMVALFATIALRCQTAAGGATPCLDENQVHQAMREEAFRLLAQKIDAVSSGAGGGFDYHIEQAYEKIKNRLPADPLSPAELEVWLRTFLQNPKADGPEHDFHTLIENFILGMSLEIINTLQYECEQVEDLIAAVAKLEDELKKTPEPDRDALARALRQSGLSRKTAGIVKDIDRSWRVPAAGADHFSAFSTWKKNMTGRNADRDLRLVFELGDRYGSRYPFLDDFMGKYRSLAEAFRQAVLDLNVPLDAGADADADVPD
jgi:hypothetical protein